MLKRGRDGLDYCLTNVLGNVLGHQLIQNFVREWLNVATFQSLATNQVAEAREHALLLAGSFLCRTGSSTWLFIQVAEFRVEVQLARSLEDGSATSVLFLGEVKLFLLARLFSPIAVPVARLLTLARSAHLVIPSRLILLPFLGGSTSRKFGSIRGYLLVSEFGCCGCNSLLLLLRHLCFHGLTLLCVADRGAFFLPLSCVLKLFAFSEGSLLLECHTLCQGALLYLCVDSKKGGRERGTWIHRIEFSR
mmetsp:Transcript_4886/g.11978  ORF Transcript_4886/g.11978 Transcript_4886/m.11978 type:complete len:249 (-) Transcript_4886:312-1058(-)